MSFGFVTGNFPEKAEFASMGDYFGGRAMECESVAEGLNAACAAAHYKIKRGTNQRQEQHHNGPDQFYSEVGCTRENQVNHVDIQDENQETNYFVHGKSFLG
jgi:hypothetical protein